ncbi:Uncharacterised protein [Salmonella enterica subsp. diarizonae]|uniref:Uncharacterized protein n=1 Tax=Salmonella diarizonae TaxID=59204 RepID=A0A379TYF0_SALDZ|nr:Uncharacterised protein [Salmonella enterica subsp. diarizonae]
MSGAIFARHITMFLSWGRHTGVKNLYFRIINMFGKPVGGDKKGGGHGHLHCYLIMVKLSDVSRKGTSRRGCFGWRNHISA